MFEPLESRVETKKRVATLCVSLFLHATVIAVLVIVPLIYYNVLPKPELLTFLTEPPMPPPPPPPAPPKQVYHLVKQISRFVAPTVIPNSIPPPTPEAAVMDSSELEGVPGGVAGGVVGGIPDGILNAALGIHKPVTLAPPPPPPPRPVPHKAIRVGGDVQAGKLIYRVSPLYPVLARQARVQGSVILQVMVDEKGNVTDVRVVRGHPLLESAAVEAVQKWKYKPTFLNGQPVAVISNVVVTFTLDGGLG